MTSQHTPDPAERRAQRRRAADEAAAYHHAAAARAREAEARRTAPMVEDFAAAMRAAGVPTTSLRARPYSGRGTMRTDVTGWYVRRDRSIGVGVDGCWYPLVVAPTLRGRLTGIHLDPGPAPLQVGAGGRDGDSVALDVLLDLRLSAGADFPA